MTHRLLAFLSLFTSLGTLLCCALPALLVVLGFGASFAGLIGVFPQLVTLSEHKTWIFGIGGILLALSWLMGLWYSQPACSPGATTPTACDITQDSSKIVFKAAVVCYAIGATFAYLLPLFLQ